MKIDINEAYTGGYDAAKFIENNIKNGSTFLVTQESNLVAPIIAYLNKGEYKFYSVSEERYFTYQIWDDVWGKQLYFEKVNILINHQFKNQENVYLLTSKFNQRDKTEYWNSFDKIYDTGSVYGNWGKTESYKIYKLPGVKYDK